MVRILTLLVAALALGSCRDGAPASPSAGQTTTISAQNANDTRVAKALFGAMMGPASMPADPIGEYARGCQAGAVQLAETGPTWQAMRLSRNRNWGQPELIDYVQDLSAFAATLPGWNGLYLGDMSQPRGGPMLTGHASHQIGLDADIWMLPATRLDLSRDEREAISSTDMQRASGAYVNDNWTPQHEALLRAAASDPRVNRIFVFAGAKVEMCNNATGDTSWLHKIRPWYGHNYHFHVRLNCPPGATNCAGQAAIPEGDGCDDARQWVADILNPPPPDPNAPPPEPRRELTMASLPGLCLDVLNAN
jgi:penicillin-insensitive murein DD-endopeptidase